MKSKKALLAIALFTFLGSALHAQKRFAYTYDGAGNRIKRKVAESVTKEAKVDSTAILLMAEKISEEKTAHLGSCKIEAYPNPVQDNLHINITSDHPFEPLNVMVYNSSGVLLKKVQMASPFQELSFRQYPVGAYMIWISNSKGEKVCCKIIKC